MSDLTYTEGPDYGIWTRAVERVVEDFAEADFYPAEEAVAALVAEMSDAMGRPLHPDTENDQQLVEDELIAIYG